MVFHPRKVVAREHMRVGIQGDGGAARMQQTGRAGRHVGQKIRSMRQAKRLDSRSQMVDEMRVTHAWTINHAQRNGTIHQQSCRDKRRRA